MRREIWLKLKRKNERSFLDSLYKQYSPELSKEELESALKNYETKDIYEKKLIIAQLKYLKKANTLDSFYTSYMSVFTLFLSTLTLYITKLFDNIMFGYILIILLFIYVFSVLSKGNDKNRKRAAETEYLLALLDEK